MEKRAMHITRKWKNIKNIRKETAKIRTNQNVRRKRNLQELGNIESWHFQTSEDERKRFLKSISQTKKTTFQNQTLHKKSHQRINTWAVFLEKFTNPFLRWTRKELKQMEQGTRELMTIYKSLQPSDDIDGLYVSSVRGLTCKEDSVHASIWRLENDIKKNKEIAQRI